MVFPPASSRSVVGALSTGSWRRAAGGALRGADATAVAGDSGLGVAWEQPIPNRMAARVTVLLVIGFSPRLHATHAIPAPEGCDDSGAFGRAKSKARAAY